MAENFFQIHGKLAILSGPMAKVQSMEIVLDAS